MALKSKNVQSTLDLATFKQGLYIELMASPRHFISPATLMVPGDHPFTS